ncbi:putative purine permease 16 [Cardamine amara subsp. amara]|uniref:Purine permease 16 n=1 Tax=Cardamine amara subsp. amara TaxID=228776 RepID=A0ABD1B5H3_CARAN
MSEIEFLKLNQRKWWISVFFYGFLIFAGDSLDMLLLSFFYRSESDQDRQYKGTWTQALIQNAVFPILIPLFFIFPSPKPNPEETVSNQTNNGWFRVFSLYISLADFFGGPAFAGTPDEDESDAYDIKAWLILIFPTLAFSLSLCLMQLGFERLLVKTKRYASGEFKKLKGDSERFKKGKTYYILSLVGLALSWQVWAVGLLGLVLLVSGVFADVVHRCASPVVALLVVLAFDFMDDDFGWQRRGALIGAVLALASYFYYLHKTKEEETAELTKRENSNSET